MLALLGACLNKRKRTQSSLGHRHPRRRAKQPCPAPAAFRHRSAPPLAPTEPPLVPAPRAGQGRPGTGPPRSPQLSSGGSASPSPAGRRERVSPGRTPPQLQGEPAAHRLTWCSVSAGSWEARNSSPTLLPPAAASGGGQHREKSSE